MVNCPVMSTAIKSRHLLFVPSAIGDRRLSNMSYIVYAVIIILLFHVYVYVRDDYDYVRL